MNEKIFSYIENRPLYIIISLFLFHITVACLMSWLAYSPYFSALHNGQGFWKFSIDSTLYHQEALKLVDVLNEGKWKFWWSSYPTHLHVKWLALIYWMIGEPIPILFEVVNSFVWVLSVILIYRASYYLFNRNVKVACFSTLFLFFPSVVLSSTQLLREPFYILGLCFTLFGWVVLYRLDSNWRGVLSIVIGFFLVVSTRDYLTPIMFSIFLVWGLVAVFYKHVERAPVLAMLFIIYILSFGDSFSGITSFLSPLQMKGNGFVAEIDTDVQPFHLSGTKTYNITRQPIKDKNGEVIYMVDEIIEENGKFYIFVNSKLIEIINPYKDISSNFLIGQVKKPATSEIIESKLSLKENNRFKERSKFLAYFDQKIAQRLGAMRHGFRKVNLNSGSGIDENIRYKSIEDILIYMPRALQIGFLSPFPYQWFSPGRQTGKVGKLIAGLETGIFYLVLIGFLGVLFTNKKILLPFIPVLIFSGSVIMLLGFAVPNVGTIYRMRQGLLIPYFIIGVYGISVLISELKIKLSKK